MEVRNEETLRKTPGFLAWAMWKVTPVTEVGLGEGSNWWGAGEWRGVQCWR